jgi:hypothetical protein
MAKRLQSIGGIAKRGTILAALIAQGSYHNGQGFPADPPQARFFCQLLLLQADGLDKVLHNFLVILLKSIGVSHSKSTMPDRKPP